MPTNPAGAATAVPGPKGLTPRGLSSMLSRTQGNELFFIQPFTPLDTPIIPRNVNLSRPLESLEVIWRGRVTIGVANYAAVAAEAPATIIQRIRLTGTHRQFNQLIPIDLTGATAFAWPRLFQQQGNLMLINGVAQPDPSVPFAQLPANFGNIGSYDLEIHYVIPTGPVFGPGSRRSQNYFLYQPTDWADTLQLQLFFGDASSFGTPGAGTTVTFSSYGSNAGTPSVNIQTNYAILGPLANSLQSGVVIRNEQNVIAGSVSAIANAQRLALLQKNKTTNIVIKTGILETGASPGVSVFASLSDSILDRTQIIVDNKPIRNNQANFAQKSLMGRMFNTLIPGGYFVFSFVDSQSPLTYFRADTQLGGSTFELDSDVLSATANQASTFVQEQVLGTPRGKA